MPIMDGHMLIEEYIKRGWKLPKIVVITASVMEKDKIQGKNHGIEYFITKSFDFLKLKNIMRDLLDII